MDHSILFYMFMGSFVMGVLGILYFTKNVRKATLDRLELMAGEEVLFDDAAPRRIESDQGGRTNYYPKAFLRITSRRIILAQRPLFREEPKVIRLVIYYRERKKLEGIGGEIFKAGHISINSDPGGLEVGESKKHGAYILLKSLEEPGLMKAIPSFIKIYTERLDEYKRALALR